MIGRVSGGDWPTISTAVAAAVAGIVGAVAAGANVLAVREMRRDRQAERAGRLAEELTNFYHHLADLQQMPLAGDLTGFNRTIEGSRRFLALSGLNLSASNAVVEEWQSGKENPDPRPLIPAALQEIEAIIEELRSAEG